MDAPVDRFEVRVASEDIADLNARLARTRWPDEIDGGQGLYGIPLALTRSLCEAWQGFDWRAFEARLNAWPQFTTRLRGQHLHFMHVRSPEPHALPLLLTHGWPGSVAEFLEVLGPLSNPRAHGLDPAIAFHVVAPSIPGYGFSGPTHAPGFDVVEAAAVGDTLMQGLGYARYGAQGGDWGAVITSWLASIAADRLVGIHLNMVPVGPPDPAQPLMGLTAEEAAGLARGRRYQVHESGYLEIQKRTPQTVAYGLEDSPAGLLAWIVEKFAQWSDQPDPLRAFGAEKLLTNASIYWLTHTIHSSMRLYFESLGEGRYRPFPPVTVPTACAIAPGEITQPPRAWAQARYRIERWSRLPRGGHFLAMQEPALFVDELRSFFTGRR